MIEYLFYGSGRQLTKIIKNILYKGITKQVFKENYITEYKLENKKIKKENIKKVIFIGDKKKIEEFLKNNPNFKKWK